MPHSLPRALQPQVAIDADVFDLAPVPLWLEDWTDLKVLLKSLHPANGAALTAMLLEDRERIRACAALTRVIRVNPAVVEMLDADNVDHLRQNLDFVFTDESLTNFAQELGQIWDKGACVLMGVNRSLTGRRIDIMVRSRVMPGHEADWDRVLVSTEDLTALQGAKRLAERAERYANALFEHSPVSLWVLDFGEVKRLLDGLREFQVDDFRAFFEVHPEFIERCLDAVRLVDVNRATLALYGARDRLELAARAGDIQRAEMRASFRDTLIGLAAGRLVQGDDVVQYSLDGAQLYLHRQFAILPGREADWSQALVALTDFTARKKAESYLEFLGRNDALTKLHNRGFYMQTLQRLERNGPFPATAIVIDLNGIKLVNDRFGHARGDQLLVRAADALRACVKAPNVAARIGGDEFVVLMPGADAAQGARMVADIRRAAAAGDPERRPDLAIGVATGAVGERIEDVVKAADAAMYVDKRAHYGGRRGD